MILTLVSCAEKKTDVPRISLSPIIINSDLATNFPRELKVDGQYFYTPTMLSSGKVFSIYDISTGDEIASIQDNNNIIAVIFRDEKFQVVKYQL